MPSRGSDSVSFGQPTGVQQSDKPRLLSFVSAASHIPEYAHDAEAYGVYHADARLAYVVRWARAGRVRHIRSGHAMAENDAYSLANSAAVPAVRRHELYSTLCMLRSSLIEQSHSIFDHARASDHSGSDACTDGWVVDR